MKTIKKSVSILLAVIMVFSLFTIVPFSASAATTYTINWSWRDINSHSEQTQVEEGEMPTHADPVLESDVKVNYVFDGWTPKIVPATSNAYYTAQVVEYPIFYSVGDSINFKSSEYVRGTKWSDPTYEVSGSVTVVSAVYNSENSCYDLVLQSGDDTIELTASGSVQYDNFAVQISSGSGASNYPYSFRVVRLGTVIWKGEDGNILETDENVPHGSRPTFNGTYSKESESPEDYYYVTKWFTENSDGSISTTPYSHNKLSNVSYYSNSSQKIYHGKIIKVKYLKPGVVYFHQDGIDFNNSYAKLSSASGVYRRSGMNIISELRLYNASNNEYIVGLASDSGATYYYTKLDESLGEKVAWKCVSGDGTQDNPYTFEFVPYGDVTWKLDEDTVIDTTKVVYGDAPTHDDPTKADDEQNSYTFAGWSDGTNFYRPNALPRVTGDITFTAIFDAIPKPHTHDGITFQPWYSEYGLPSTAGDYYLTQDVRVPVEWKAPAGTTRICLNGHKIKTSEHLLMGSGTVLEVYDEEGGGSIDASYRVGSMFWIKGGKFVLNGGTINGNVSTAGIVDIAANATFTMNGGTLTGTSVGRYDACGVRFTGSGGTFNMTGGEITGLSTFAGVTYFEKTDVNINISGSAKIYNNKLSNGTVRNLYFNKVGGTTAAINVGELDSDATIGVTMQTPGVFTNTSNNDVSKFSSDNSSYAVGKNADGKLMLGVPRTITWKDDQGNTIDTTTVFDGETPTHDAPAKNDANGNPYTFGGWKNGTTTYAPDAALPAVTGDTTYTATYEKLIRAHSLTLDGDIGINFFIDPSVAGMNPGDSGTLKVDFEWANDDPLVDVVSQSKSVAVNSSNYSRVGDLVKVTCNVCAAEMTCDVKATASLNGKTEAEYYSVRKYCDTILDDTSDEGSRIKASYDEAKYSQLIDLVVKMLDYGAKAQTTFGINTGYLANKDLDYTMEDVTDDMFTDAIQPAEGTDISANNIATDTPAGAAFKAPSLVFLTKNTLRLYFEKTGDSFNTSGLTKWNNYYYAQVTNIAAAELDTLQVFNVSGKTLYYSAFDYAKLLLNTSNADIAMALYWYNQAANKFFNDPNEVYLSTLEADYEAQNGQILTGTLSSDKKITIAPGATVTLRNADITCLTDSAEYAGITPLGDATILLEGTNAVKGGYKEYPGIFVPEGKTLTIDGTGSLTATSGGEGQDKCACGIGAGSYGKPAGNIVINGGKITAIGGDMSAGIGSSFMSNCGDITITGGTVIAYSEDRASGIGTGHGFDGSTCGNITISGGYVTATGSIFGAGIGTGMRGTCGDILITAGVTQVTATKGNNGSNSIGAGNQGTCGTVTIEPGANVIQN